MSLAKHNSAQTGASSVLGAKSLREFDAPVPSETSVAQHEIPTTLADLQSLIHEQRSIVESLISRLQPICRSLPDNTADKVPKAATTSLGACLSELHYNLNFTTNLLLSLLSSIEL